MSHPFHVPLQIIFFLIGLTVAGRIASDHAPFPPRIAYRFDAFESIKDEVTIVFLGSSHTQGSIYPPVIDQTFDELGSPQKVFNLGIRAGYNHQVNHMLDRVLRLRPKNLKLIVIEPLDWRTQSFDLQEYLSFMWWHTPLETLSVLRSTGLERATFAEHLEEMGHHLKAGAVRSLNIGMLTAYRVEQSQLGHVSGWVPFSDLKGGKHQREQFLKGISRFQDRLDSYPARRSRKPRLERYNIKAQKDQIRKLRDRGISLVYLLPPSLEEYSELRELHLSGVVSTLIDRSDPEKFPAYFEPENRHDWSHLNEQGARLFSADVANALFDAVPELRGDRSAAPSGSPGAEGRAEPGS